MEKTRIVQKIKSFATTIALLLFSILLAAQSTAVIDSLQKELAVVEQPREKVRLLNNLASQVSFSDFTKATEYCEEALLIAQKEGFQDLESEIYYNLGRINLSVTDLEQAKIHTLKALELAKIVDDKNGLNNTYVLLGGILGMQDDLDAAFESFMNAKVLSEELNNESSLGSIYNNIGYIFKAKEDHENARKYFLKALPLFEKLNHKRFLINVYNNLAESTKDADEAIAYGQKALAVVNTTPDNLLSMSFTLLNLGHLYQEKKQDYPTAISYHRQALVIDQKMKAVSRVLDCKYGLGVCFLGLNQLDSAAFYLQQAVTGFSEQDNNRLDDYKRASFMLAQTFQRQGKIDRAYDNLMTSYELKDSTFKKDIAQSLAKQDALLETEQREREIAEQELEIARQKQLRSYFALAALALFALLAGLFQYFFYRQRRKKREAELALQSEQQEAERLREVNRLKSTFFTNISHELRTPLTLVAAPLQDALEAVKPGPLKNHLHLAESNTQKLLHLVNEILDLSKLEAGKVVTKSKVVELLPLVRRIFYSFESVAQLRQIELDFSSSIAPDTKVQVDIAKLEKILNNLCSNALKYTDSGGKVSLQLSQQANRFSFAISDTGSGIAPKDLTKIFDRFYQVAEADTPLRGGTGIGLALAKELADLLGGTLNATSTLGQGSCFTLQLPLDQQSSESPLATEAIAASESIFKPSYAPLLLNGQKPRLLLVEDNPEMSQYLVQSLGEHYQCTTALDGQSALKLLEQQHFDLITSDVMMPNMDGFAFKEQVNAHEKWRSIPFILLTARALEDDKLKGFRLGADDYLTKPFSLKELQARIHNLLRNKIARENPTTETEEDTEEPAALSNEEQLLRKAEAFVLEKLDDPQLRVDDLAQALHFSSRHLSRTMRKLTGLTPVNFILELRLQKARQLLESRQFVSVAEVRYEIGIESASYFTTKFTERFGKNPKEYLS